MDPIKKLLIGTVVRGIMWGAGVLSAKYGVEAMSESTAEGIAAWVVAIGLALAAVLWSKAKDQKLAES